MQTSLKTPLENAMASTGVYASELARATDVYPSTITRIFDGHRPSLALAERIVHFLNGKGAQLTELHVLYPERYTKNNKG